MNASPHSAPADREALSRFADTLDAVAAAPSPANDEARRAYLRAENARYYQSRLGLARQLVWQSEDRGMLLQRMDYLLASMVEAIHDDADWGNALCHIGSSWLLHEKQRLDENRKLYLESCQAVIREEEGAQA